MIRPAVGEQALLRLVHSRRATSQIELARALQLPANTVHGMVRRLIEQGILEEVRTERGGRGRPAKHFALRLPAAVLAVEFTGTEWRGVVVTGEGATERDVVQFQSSQIPDIKSATSYLMNVRDAALKRVNLRREDLAGAVLLMNAALLPGDGKRLSSVIPWLSRLSESSLSRKLGCPVVFSMRPSKAEVELRNWSREGVRSVVAFNVGDGVSAHYSALVGPSAEAQNLVGEVGHIVMQPGTHLCGCGHRGCLETFIAGPQVMHRVREKIGQGIKTGLSHFLDAPPADFFQHLDLLEQNGDAYAVALVQKLLEHCAWGLSVAINMFRPDLIVLTGYILHGREAWRERIAAKLPGLILQREGEVIRLEFSRSSSLELLRDLAVEFFFRPPGGSGGPGELAPAILQESA